MGTEKQKDVIFKYIEENKDYVVGVLDRLIRANTVNPPGNEIEAARVVSDELEKLNLPYEIYEKEAGRANILTRLGEGSPSLMLISHLDVVPPGEGWDHPPLQATLRGDRIYGRGSVDNKGQMASSLLALKALRDLEIPIPGTLFVLGAADEERGSAMGVRYLLEEGKISSDFVLVTEATNGGIEIAEKGSAGGRLISKGVQAHGSMPEKGINAIIKMAKVLARLEGFRFTFRPDPLLGGPTINVGMIKGGIAGNVVPPSCEAQLDIRIVPGMDANTVKRDLESFIAKIKEEDPEINILVDIPRSIPATSISPDSPFPRILGEVVEEVTGMKPNYFGIGGMTVAKLFILRGIQAPVFSLGDEGLCHMANEYITIKELIDNAKVYALLATRLDKIR
jgi:acetylornithine deacetylase/succinyl-diaminopimelate desuccinylase family protein